jgi:glutaredoxin 3
MTRIILYTTPFCGYCSAAKRLLSTKGVAFTEIDVSEDAAKREEMISRATGRRTVPQIFIDGSHVGGYEECAALERASRLAPWLAELEAVAGAAGQ